MHPFEQYLQDNNIEPLTLSVVAKVRYMTVWSAMKGKPISCPNARQLLYAARMLTGILYTGQMELLPNQPIEQAPTVPIKAIKSFK